MSLIDGIVLFGTLAFIVAFGVWRTRGRRNMESYLLGGKEAEWWTVGLSVMATQASAITFLSTPGQAFDDGMRFVQFYFGLPLAMVILCVTFIPLYYRLKVYTAYEFLENRFDLKTRTLAASLFLIQRGLAAGITIYAPAIILSTILGWQLYLTNLIIGVLVIIYTVAGGTKAVSVTQKQQMLVIMTGMFVAFYLILDHLPEGIGFGDALDIAGATGKLNVIDFSLDVNNRYTFWSGITGGLFLALSYFGTDQSQVQRYLSARSVKESRLGLIFNGLVKVPMQFFILLTGVMVFVFYQFERPPLFFNESGTEEIYASSVAGDFRQLESEQEELFVLKKERIEQFVQAKDQGDATAMATARVGIKEAVDQEKELRLEARKLIDKGVPQVESNDKDYVFISFIMKYLPKGLIGLLLAVIFSAAMSSTSAELNALASTTCVDMYKRSFNSGASDAHYVKASRWFTFMWGIVAILFATFGTLFENLIQFVNIIGSIFYGTILGIFLVAFYIKWIKGRAVFIAALIAEAIVLTCFFATDIGYLWFNVIGCFGVISFGALIQLVGSGK
jgi:SSS family solute:Na+ symporter